MYMNNNHPEQLNTEECEKEFDEKFTYEEPDNFYSVKTIWKHTIGVPVHVKDFISKAITNERELSEKRGYKRGISDKNVWNGVYNIGAIEERERIVGIIENIYQKEREDCPDGLYFKACTDIINQINQGV